MEKGKIHKGGRRVFSHKIESEVPDVPTIGDIKRDSLSIDGVSQVDI